MANCANPFPEDLEKILARLRAIRLTSLRNTGTLQHLPIRRVG
jgi:hypothetical protein